MGFTKCQTKVESLEDSNLAIACMLMNNSINIDGLSTNITASSFANICLQSPMFGIWKIICWECVWQV